MARRGEAVKVKEKSQTAAMPYRLQLFVVGAEPNSRRARENLLQISEGYLKGRCAIEVVNVLHDYQRALDNGVLVAPTLIAHIGDRRVVVAGSLSDAEAVLAALQLDQQDPKP